MRKARPTPLIQGIAGRSVCSIADRALLSRARIIGEGKVELPSSGEAVFRGSVMVEMELAPSEIAPGEPSEEMEALARALCTSISFKLRLLRTARRETERLCSPWLPRNMETELEFNIAGRKLLIDIEVESLLATPTQAADDGVEGPLP